MFGYNSAPPVSDPMIGPSGPVPAIMQRSSGVFDGGMMGSSQWGAGPRWTPPMGMRMQDGGMAMQQQPQMDMQFAPQQMGPEMMMQGMAPGSGVGPGMIQGAMGPDMHGHAGLGAADVGPSGMHAGGMGHGASGFGPGATGGPHDDKGISRTTVYVGGLSTSEGPDGVDETAVHNFFFSRCGPVRSIRMQQSRGCCFVEFDNEASAREALLLNGAPAVLRPELPNSAVRLMVRPAYERPRKHPGMAGSSGGVVMGGPAVVNQGWEANPQGSWEGPGGSAWQGMQAHGEAQQGSGPGEWWPSHRQAHGEYGGNRRPATRTRSPSPPRFPHYSDAENRKLKELLKLSVDEIEALPQGSAGLIMGAPGPGGNLLFAINTICSWMEAGECGKKTADNFFVYLQHIHTKLVELRRAEEERAQRRRMEDLEYWARLNTQCDAAYKAFSEARRQKVKDNFSKVQRKNVDRWVATAEEGSRRYSALLGVDAPSCEDMELEAQKQMQPASAASTDLDASPMVKAPSAPPPPPPSSAPSHPPPAPATDARDAKRVKTEAADNAESALTARMAALERLLMEKLEGTQPGVPMPSAVGPGAVGSQSSPDAATLCVASALSVHLASYPQGAKVSQLCSYIACLCKLEHPLSEGGVQKVQRLVRSALTLAPGVFTEVAAGSGESSWVLTALQTVPSLFMD